MHRGNPAVVDVERFIVLSFRDRRRHDTTGRTTAHTKTPPRSGTAAPTRSTDMTNVFDGR
jgi:hypothetical protein